MTSEMRRAGRGNIVLMLLLLLFRLNYDDIVLEQILVTTSNHSERGEISFLTLLTTSTMILSGVINFIIV